jgi:hypothetical protein
MQSNVKDEVCDFDNLYRAMLHCKHNVMWKPSVAGYVKNGLVNIYKLKHSIEDGTYELSEYTAFKVYEPKERDIVSTRMKDRVFQRSYCDNYFYPKMTKSFIHDNCACQIGKGNEVGRKRLICHLQKYIRKHGLDGWVFQFDLTNFFGSTQHEQAMNAVKKRLDDEWAVSEAERVVNSFNQGADPDVGMGLGSEETQIIELAVLDDLDHIIKEQLHIKHYVRYNDDAILLHEDKEYLKECWKFIDTWLSAKGLKMSVKKTRLYPIKQGIKFLGFRFTPKETGKVVMTVLPEKVSHERRKLRKLVERAKAGLMTKEEVDRCYESWKAHVGNQHKKGTVGKKAHRDTHNLIICMDKYYKSLWR